MLDTTEDQVPIVREDCWYGSITDVHDRLASATSVAGVLGCRTQEELGRAIQGFVACGIRAARIDRDRRRMIASLSTLARKRNSDGRKAKEQLVNLSWDREALIVNEALNFTRAFLRYLQDPLPFDLVLTRDRDAVKEAQALLHGLDGGSDSWWMRSIRVRALESLGVRGFWCFASPGTLPPMEAGWHAECLATVWREQGVPLPADGSLPWRVTRHGYEPAAP